MYDFKKKCEELNFDDVSYNSYYGSAYYMAFMMNPTTSNRFVIHATFKVGTNHVDLQFVNGSPRQTNLKMTVEQFNNLTPEQVKKWYDDALTTTAKYEMLQKQLKDLVPNFKKSVTNSLKK